MYKQDAPFAVQVELVEGCQLRCPMCALNGIRNLKIHDYKFMSEETLRSVMQQMVEADWNPRIEFAMHGEPTMHPDFAGMVRIAREEAPKYHLMMTSNGGGLLRQPGPLQHIQALFDAGLNVLALDEYDGIDIISKIRTALYDTGMPCYEYPADITSSPHTRRKLSDRRVIFIEDINKASKGTHSHINNHAGVGGLPLQEPLQQRCAKPFRELAVRWDGNVAVCCNDFRGTYKCGNIVTDGLLEVWNGLALQSARQVLYNARRDLLQPCNVCDAVSYRVGLLPDKFGKERLSMPNAKAKQAIANAVAGAPYTAPVARAWEK